MNETSAWVATLMVLLSAVSGGCSDSSISCNSAADCVQGGIPGACEPSPSSATSWCTFNDPSCPDGRRWGAGAGDDLARICAASGIGDAGVPDAMLPDAAATQPAFDVVYADEWKFSVPEPAVGCLAIVNRSVLPLSLKTLHVRSISDDHPTAAVIVKVMNHTQDLRTGESGGKLSQAVLVGMVPETNVDASDLMSVEVANAPQGAYDIKVDLVLELDGLAIPMPFIVHHPAAPTIFYDATHGKRITVTR